MILEKETYEKFGYYPSDLKPKSNKKILVACDDCGKIRGVCKKEYHPLCHHCAQIHSQFKRRNKIFITCDNCTEGFERHPSSIRNSNFCSRKCYGEWISKNIKGENSSHWKGGKIERICQTCDKHFFVDPSEIKNGKGNFCSFSCARKGRKGFPTHHTKPELIFEEICKKYDLQYKYTGDGAFWIGKNPSVNPDFVECNGKKIAIEIFSYWHDPLRRFGKVPYSGTYEGRKKILKKYGWKLVVFWQEDLEREDVEQFVLNTLKNNGI